MPSFTIHLAVAKRYLERHPDEDEAAFFQGIIAPDLKQKPESHYGDASSDPDLEKYKREVGLESSYNRGYYLHLLTDFLFYHDFIEPHKFSDDIYEDYDNINHGLINLYDLIIPEEVKDRIKCTDEIYTRVIDRRLICYFVEYVGSLELTFEPIPGDVLCYIGNCIHKDEHWFTDDCDDLCKKYYELAAGKGHCEAICRLGILYADDGVGWYYPEMDCGEPSMFPDKEDAEAYAAEQYKKAIEKDYPMAYWLLGNLYIESDNADTLHFDKKKGEKLLKIAKQKGITKARGRRFQFKYRAPWIGVEQEKYNFLEQYICRYLLNNSREFQNVDWENTLVKIREKYILQNKQINDERERELIDEIRLSCLNISGILCEIPMNYTMAIPKGILQLLTDLRADKNDFFRYSSINNDFQWYILRNFKGEYALPILAMFYKKYWCPMSKSNDE